MANLSFLPTELERYRGKVILFNKQSEADQLRILKGERKLDDFENKATISILSDEPEQANQEVITMSDLKSTADQALKKTNVLYGLEFYIQESHKLAETIRRAQLDSYTTRVKDFSGEAGGKKYSFNALFEAQKEESHYRFSNSGRGRGNGPNRWPGRRGRSGQSTPKQGRRFGRRNSDSRVGGSRRPSWNSASRDRARSSSSSRQKTQSRGQSRDFIVDSKSPSRTYVNNRNDNGGAGFDSGANSGANRGRSPGGFRNKSPGGFRRFSSGGRYRNNSGGFRKPPPYLPCPVGCVGQKHKFGSAAYCPRFLKLSIEARRQLIKSLKLCQQCCLRNAVHSSSKPCRSPPCQTCGAKGHHTLICPKADDGTLNRENLKPHTIKTLTTCEGESDICLDDDDEVYNFSEQDWLDEEIIFARECEDQLNQVDSQEDSGDDYQTEDDAAEESLYGDSEDSETESQIFVNTEPEKKKAFSYFSHAERVKARRPL